MTREGAVTRRKNMADQTEFKHITVNPAEADDVVIHAGAPKSEDESLHAGTQQENSAQEPSVSPQSVKPEESPADSPATSDASAMPTKPKAASSKQDADSYHPTTLEDIEGSKMPKTQIVVIVVAIVAIIAFAVWYMAFS